MGRPAPRPTGLVAGPALSAHGRFVVFELEADNLVPGDTNLASDIFVRDRSLRTTIWVSVGVNGRQANAASSDPSISSGGHFVAFTSEASNLVVARRHQRCLGTSSSATAGPRAAMTAAAE